jgi:epoxyqueuosine reductase
MSAKTDLDLSRSIKTKGEALGFDLIGICPAEYSPESHERLLQWLRRGFHADLAYLERNPRMRSDARLFFPGAKSVISVAKSYYIESNYDPAKPYISIYARCRPYQDIIKAKLGALLEYIKSLAPETRGKIAVDTSPTFDRYWANRAGLGWPGKNTMLINKRFGSFLFLGELFVDIDIEPDKPEIDRCGDCSRCIEACPSGALVEPRVLDASKCISYLTTATDIDSERASRIGGHILGCEICQLVCPYNQNAEPSDSRGEMFTDIDFNNLALKDYIDLTEPRFNDTFKGTIIAQKGFYKFRHNTLVAQYNTSAFRGLS